MFLLLILMQIFILVFVFETRKIKSSETKAAATIIYFITLAVVVLVIATFALPDHQDTSTALSSIALLMSSFATLITVFTMKVSLPIWFANGC